MSPAARNPRASIERRPFAAIPSSLISRSCIGLLVFGIREEDTNTVPENYEEEEEEHVVEFSVTMVVPGYSAMLKAESLQYNQITRDLTARMHHVFQRIPGFKEIRVLGFRSEDVSVRYAVIFSGHAEPGEPTEAVESVGSGASGAELHPTAPQLQDIVAKNV
ncbi:hypothetical protein CRUP_034494 [Coryphaenoides rupestris]|nr:hypothetical protein CRUP_034494 [Coryphaenoides rupestris]